MSSNASEERSLWEGILSFVCSFFTMHHFRLCAVMPCAARTSVTGVQCSRRRLAHEKSLSFSPSQSGNESESVLSAEGAALVELHHCRNCLSLSFRLSAKHCLIIIIIITVIKFKARLIYNCAQIEDTNFVCVLPT